MVNNSNPPFDTKVISTLFQRPNQVKETESPREQFSPEAGFTIVVPGKRV
ncbi:hypothetical protein ES703_17360 [subsurface metagenome]